MPLRIKNLAGVFTGEGFVTKQGRYPKTEDCGFHAGPIDICCDDRGRIEAITRTTTISHSNAELFDGTGLVATAGFVDSHTHAIFSGIRASEFFMRWQGVTYPQTAQSSGGIYSTVRATNQASNDQLRSLLHASLDKMLQLGCTTIEVKSGYADSVDGEIRLLRLISEVKSKRIAPRVLATFLGLHAPPLTQDSSVYCQEMIAALPIVVSENLAVHVDSFPEAGFFSLEQSYYFSRAALKYQLPVKVHADELSRLGTSEAFIKMGARSIDHLIYIGSDAIRLLANSATVATLLPTTSFFLGVDYADARRLLNAGARVALSSDFNPGTSPVTGMTLTLLLAASCLKMTAAEILCAATYNSAAALGRESEIGVLIPNSEADMLLWRTDTRVQHNQCIDILNEIIVSGLHCTTAIVSGKVVHDTRTEFHG